MQFKILTTVILLFFYTNKIFCAPIPENFSGNWCSDLNDNISTFCIEIKKQADIYKGSYSAVLDHGNILDNHDDAFTFKAKNQNKIITKIKADDYGKEGSIQLKLLHNKKLEWRILRKPGGEYYLPSKALLHRCIAEANEK